ncbi:MAG: hypothetical protein KJ069_27495 [Anaerolineae bacterium]|nr:hypothetical protein [Anaerolineae bacterium]
MSDISDIKETDKTPESAQNNLDMIKIQAAMRGEKEQQAKVLQEDLKQFDNRPKPPRVEAAMQSEQKPILPVNEGVHWQDKGIVDVPTADLPWPEDVHGPQDFDHHISYPEAVQATYELQRMKPLIEQGYTRDDFAQADRIQGVDYANGRQQVYDLFYGSNAITLDKDGNNYDIVNGRHRIFVAKEQGLDSIPAHVREKIAQ